MDKSGDQVQGRRGTAKRPRKRKEKCLFCCDKNNSWPETLD